MTSVERKHRDRAEGVIRTKGADDPSMSPDRAPVALTPAGATLADIVYIPSPTSAPGLRRAGDFHVVAVDQGQLRLAVLHVAVDRRAEIFSEKRKLELVVTHAPEAIRPSNS